MHATVAVHVLCAGESQHDALLFGDAVAASAPVGRRLPLVALSARAAPTTQRRAGLASISLVLPRLQVITDG